MEMDRGAARRALTSLLPALDHARRCVARLTEDDLRMPTPCGRWDVGDVLGHMAESLECIDGALRRGFVPSADDDGEPCLELGPLRTRLEAAARSLAAAATWRGQQRVPVMIAGLPLGRQQLLHVAALEAAVHAWDTTVAVGVHQPIDEGLAASLLSGLEVVVNAHTAEGAFAPPLACRADAPSSDRLLAALGRDPRWRAGAA
jgi:uncharacterized protein (TIGR03086 family)